MENCISSNYNGIYQKPLKSKIHDIMWDGANPYPDT